MCMLVCVHIYVCMCFCVYMPRSSGRGFKIKRIRQNKDIENCSLKSVSYSAFSSNLEIKLALHFSHI